MAENHPRLVLFDSLNNPFKGINTANDPSSLQDGVWALSHNVRSTGMTVDCRGGTSNLGLVSTFVGGQFRGVWEGTFNGVRGVLFAAAVIGVNSVGIFKSTDAVVWTEITAGSGVYGNSRMTDPNVLFSMEKVQDTIFPFNGGQDCLVIQNGVDAPRIYGHSNAVNAMAVATVTAIAPPLAIRDTAVNQIVSSTALSYAVFSGGAFVNSTGTRFHGANHVPASTTNQEQAELEFFAGDGSGAGADVGVRNGDSVQITYASSSLFQGNQILIGFDTTYGDFIHNTQIKIGASVIWDPTNGSFPSFYIIELDPTGGTAHGTQSIYAFNIASLGLNPATANTTIKFTWVGPSSSCPQGTNQFVRIFLIAGGVSPQEVGGTQMGITYYNQGSRTESPAVVFANYQTQQIDNLIGAPNLGIAIPNSELIYFTYEIGAVNAPLPDVAGGADFFLIYRQKPEEVAFTLCDKGGVLATWGGASWSHFGGSLYEIQGSITPSPILMPDAFLLPIQIGQAMKATNQRLFVGTGSTASANVYISEYKNGFRFRGNVRYIAPGIPDETSATTLALNGEQIMAFAAVSSAIVGVPTVYIFGNEGLYATSGISASELSLQTRIGPHGTVCPASIAELRDMVFWVDKDMQVLRLARGSLQTLSRRIIDKTLRAIPATRKKYVSGACFNDKYYLSYSPVGQTTNTNILVWEDPPAVNSLTAPYSQDPLSIWESIDIPPIPAEGILSWFDPALNAPRLVYFGVESGANQLRTYEYDLSTAPQDLSVDIPITLVSRMIHGPNYDKIYIHRCLYVIDSVASSTMHSSRAYLPDPSVIIYTGSANIGKTTAQSWVIEDTPAPPAAGETGPGVQITFTALVKGGTRIYNISCEQETRDGGPSI